MVQKNECDKKEWINVILSFSYLHHKKNIVTLIKFNVQVTNNVYIYLGMIAINQLYIGRQTFLIDCGE